MTTVVEFLASKGIEVEAKPNTKLDPETYALVRSNFQGDKEIEGKGSSHLSHHPGTRKHHPGERHASALAAKQEEEEPEIDLSHFRKSEAAPVVNAPNLKAPAEPDTKAPKAKENLHPPKRLKSDPEAVAQEGPKVVGRWTSMP